MIIYLAGAIDRAKDNPAEWTNELTKELFVARNTMTLPEPLVIYSPYLAFPSNLGPGMGSLDENHATRLLHINMVAVDSANLLLVYYQPGVETWGTPMEVLRAWNNHVPIMLWASELVSLPSYLTACAGDIVYLGPKAAARAALKIDPRAVENG